MKSLKPNSRLPLSARFILALALTAGSPPSAMGAPPLGQGISRADLLKNELNIGMHDAIQVRVDFEAGASAARHRHPGVEMVYVLSGTFEYRLDGRPAVTLRAGDTLFIPTGTVHGVRNTGGGKASELATYIVDRTKPLIELVK